MGDIAVSGAGRRWRRLRSLAAVPAAIAAAWLLSACAPEYDWRDIRGADGDYWVQLPAKPATMSRRIHLEGFEVEMTMQGAKVRESAFTVARVPLPGQEAEAAGMTPERVLVAMREQMLRNIGASPSTAVQPVTVDLVDGEKRKVGQVQLQAVSARGTGRHAEMELQGRFGLWQGHALQIVAMGPQLDREQAKHFLDSLRLVKR